MGTALLAFAALATAPHGACTHTLNMGNDRLAYAAFVRRQAVAYRTPGRDSLARFGARNANGYPTLFSVLGRACGWYRVQLPLRPNGVTGYVRARDVTLAKVRTRIVVDLSARRLTLYRRGRAVQRTVVGIGAPATPTPTGRFYVNQRLVPRYKAGPWGPAALGISAFSPTLRSWTQGGPVAIHGTSDPSSIGRAASHGCVRVRNALMLKLYAATRAGTPVLIHR
jgi:lipoprotein-anchoring transpeptidase ErfK/SrfK